MALLGTCDVDASTKGKKQGTKAVILIRAASRPYRSSGRASIRSRRLGHSAGLWGLGLMANSQWLEALQSPHIEKRPFHVVVGRYHIGSGMRVMEVGEYEGHVPVAGGE